ncbi:MAG: DUF3999 domain-containing protein [Burkholderiales bacterium]|jgi:hypothetical protein|nr:DUF3999 domain-containing protein [Burkholderiales bacterium]
MSRINSLSFLFLFAGLLVAVPAAAEQDATKTRQETASKTGFHHYFALELDGNASYYLFALTPEAYQASMTLDGRDLLIIDTNGNSVPYAFGGNLETSETPKKSFLRPVPWFPLPRSQSGKNVQDGFIIATDGALRIRERQVEAEHRSGDIVDLSGIVDTTNGKSRSDDTPGLDALFVRIDISPGGTEEYLGTVEVLASNDLRSWAPVTTAQLMRLDHRGQRLERERIDFDGALLAKPPRYLQLRWRGTPPIIAGIEVELLPPRGSDPTAQTPLNKQSEFRDWRGKLSGQMLPENTVFFDTGGAFPADRLRFHLPRLNTVVPVKLYSRADENAPWRLIRAETLYRLQGRDGTEQETPEIRIAPNRDRFWKITAERENNNAGNTGNDKGNLRGAENPAFDGVLLSVGWRPETITFLAQGTPPFLLAIGNAHAADAGIPLTRLLAGNNPYLAAAHIGAPQPAPANVPSFSPRTDSLSLEEQTRRAILWGVLLAVVALLAFMAWKVAKHLPREGNDKETK